MCIYMRERDLLLDSIPNLYITSRPMKVCVHLSIWESKAFFSVMYCVGRVPFKQQDAIWFLFENNSKQIMNTKECKVIMFHTKIKLWNKPRKGRLSIRLKILSYPRKIIQILIIFSVSPRDTDYAHVGLRSQMLF